MRTLLIGGAGFVGAHLARRLLDEGHEVAAFDILDLDRGTTTGGISQAYRQRAQWLLRGAEVMTGDLADREAVRRALDRFDPDCIYNLAAVPLVGQVEANPAEAAASMTSGLANCLEVVRESRRPRRFVFVSSSMVYGHFTADPVPEEAPTSPVNLYGGLKLAGEVLTRAYLARTRHEAVIVRPSGVYGPTDVHGRVVQKCCEAALTGEPFIVTNPESTFIDFTWVEDLAAGLALAGMAPGAAGETFNLTFGGARSLEELVELVGQHHALSVMRASTDGDSRPRRGTLDISKARRLLGYAPRMTLEAGMSRYLAFLRSLRATQAAFAQA